MRLKDFSRHAIHGSRHDSGLHLVLNVVTKSVQQLMHFPICVLKRMVNCNAGLKEAVQKVLCAQGPPTGKFPAAAAAAAALQVTIAFYQGTCTTAPSHVLFQLECKHTASYIAALALF